jgi:acyl-CoA thioester hydrolase
MSGRPPTGPEPGPDAYALEIAITPDDVDVLGHVNNVVYLRWVQDAAVAHWRALATEEQQASIAWVVVRHEIDYRRPAMPGDTIVARTWVGALSRNTFERHTRIERAADGTVLAQARTLWVPLDPASGRIKEVGEDVRRRFSTSIAG